VIDTILDHQNDRDATLKLISWFDIARVRAAKILVVGAGAIGNEVLKNLALLGVGNIYIFDRDTIEMANLSRSVLFRAKDNGKPKALTAAAALKELNPSVNVYWRQGEIEADLGEGLIRQMDVVIGALDSVNARFWLNRLCWKAGRPWVDAAIGDLNGEVSVFVPPDGPCYECDFTELHYRQTPLARPCGLLAAQALGEGKVPTTPMIASLVAAVQVQECMKLLDPGAWAGRSLAGRKFYFNGRVGYVEIMGLPRRGNCPAHVVRHADQRRALTGMSAGHPAAALLAEAQAMLGPDAFLYLGSEIAIDRVCPCGNRISVLRPVRALDVEALTCSDCQRPCHWESDIRMTHEIHSGSAPDLLGARLWDLGVPWFGVVEARAGGGEVLYLELTGDAGSAVAEFVEFKEAGTVA
jgi:adenylyltransferase/sulfurtransferase